LEKRRDDSGYNKRRVFDIKTIIVIMTALFGSSGITGLTSYLTDPNIELQMKVSAIEQEEKLHYTEITAKAENQDTRMENYIKAHDNEVQLRQQLTDQEFEHIKELLQEIKTDVKSIKNGRP